MTGKIPLCVSVTYTAHA